MDLPDHANSAKIFMRNRAWIYRPDRRSCTPLVGNAGSAQTVLELSLYTNRNHTHDLTKACTTIARDKAGPTTKGAVPP